MAVDTSVRLAVEEFLFYEAHLLDSRQFDEWLDLFLDDALYWVPSNRADIDPSKEVCLIYDSKPSLQLRVTRARSELAWAQDPPSRTCRIVSNVRVEEAPEGGLTAHSSFVIFEVRKQEPKTVAGHALHVLKPFEGGFKIAQKKASLVGANLYWDNLTFLI